MREASGVARWTQWAASVRLRREASGRASEQIHEYDGYVDRLSERLYKQTLRDGGWAADVGTYGPPHFRQDADRLVHEIALGTVAEGPPTP